MTYTYILGGLSIVQREYPGTESLVSPMVSACYALPATDTAYRRKLISYASATPCPVPMTNTQDTCYALSGTDECNLLRRIRYWRSLSASPYSVLTQDCVVPEGGKLLQQALAGRQRLLGAEHVDTLVLA